MDDEGSCKEEGCLSWVFGESLALGQGWQKVGDELFCPDHWPLRSLQARNVAREARVEAARGNIRDDAARKSLTTADYANWNEFQQNLVNFHREHGKLAPVALRALGPKDWLKFHAAKGPIDVEAVAEAAAESEKTRQAAIEGRLRGL